MSHPIFRLAPRTQRPALSLVSGPNAKQSLIALASWFVKGLRPQIVDVNPLPMPESAKALHLAHPSKFATDNGETLTQTRAITKTGPSAGAMGSQPLLVSHAHLKVVVVRDGQPSQDAQGLRMVISGRMADVCAELDRLAA
jgi:hypothetical protein